jgi:hypothetical protein
VFIKKNIRIYKMDKEKNKITKFKIAKSKQEYPVYSIKEYGKNGEMLSIGSGHYIKYTKSQVTFKATPKSLTEVIGKERVWLRNQGRLKDSKGNYFDIPNLQEVIILSKKKDEDLDDWFYYKFKVGKRYLYLDNVQAFELPYLYLRDNPFTKHNYSKATWDLIKNEKIKLGMTESQVRLSWNDPDDINSYGDSWGSTDQWIYGDVLEGATFLYFDNNKLTSWQDF